MARCSGNSSKGAMSTVDESTPRSRPVSHRAVGWVLALVAVAAVAAVLHHDGVPAGDLARYGAYVVWALALPGFVVRRLLGAPARTWFGEISLAVTTGLCLELIAWAVFVGLGVGEWLAVWPVVPLVALAFPGARRRLRAPVTSSLGAVSSSAIFASALSLLWILHRQMLSVYLMPGAGQRTYLDLLWHMGLVHEARRSFPLGTPQAIDAGDLHYHWFSDAHMAAATLISGTSVPVEVLRMLPTGLYLLSFAMVVTVVTELTRTRAAVVVGAVLAAAASSFNPLPRLFLGFSSYVALSPSQMFAVPLLLFALLCVRGVVVSTPGQGRPWRLWLMLLLSFIGLSGAKASAPPSLLGGIGLVWLWAMATRTSRRAASLLLGACVVLVGVAVALVSGGDDGSGKQLFAVFSRFPLYTQVIHPRNAEEGWILPGVAAHPLILAALVCYAFTAFSLLFMTIGLTATRGARRDPFAWLLTGTILASLLALFVIRHPGMSEYYFVRGTLPLGVVGVVVLGEPLVMRLRRAARVRALGLAGAAFVGGLAVALVAQDWPARASELHRAGRLFVVVTVVVIVVWVGVSRLMGVGVLVGLLALATGLAASETAAVPLQTSRAHAQRDGRLQAYQNAGLWIDGHTPENALLATNKHCIGVEKTVCGSKEWWISGIGGRRVLVESWSYTPKSANQNPFFDVGLLARNQKAFTRADDDSLRYLRSRGVSYLVAVKGATAIAPELSTKAQKVYGNSEVTIYRLR